MEKEFAHYMNIKGQKSIGHTELNNEELMKEYASHGKKCLSMETKNGKTIFKTIKEQKGEEYA